MEKTKDTTQEIIDLIVSGRPDAELKRALDDYHEEDIAQALEGLDRATRRKLYEILDIERLAEIFARLDDVAGYLEEVSLRRAADILDEMDADEAVDVLEQIEDVNKRERLVQMMDKELSEDINSINSYTDEEIGHMMTTNFVVISENYSIKEAMSSVINQAHENDNIGTIYVINDDRKYTGAIDLKDLIVARANENLEDIISKSYPSVMATEKVEETIERLKDYAEDSIPVLNAAHEIVGAITAEDVIEAVDDEMGEDYAKLAGLTAEEDLHESLKDSMKKRLPWLALLLGLGMLVSSVVGAFESIVAQVVIVISFQSLILDMAGNVGTQSLAVTIRVLADEAVTGKDKLKFILKEMRVGATNGLLLGTLSCICVGLYLHLLKGMTLASGFAVSGCVGLALFLAMIISSLTGAAIPMFFHKIKVDPAVASGPLITTINDLVAVVTYYGLAGLLLVGMHLV